VIPARVPHNMLEVLPREEYLGKMGAVIEARNGMDKDFSDFLPELMPARLTAMTR